MRNACVLIGHSLRRARPLLLVMGAVLAGFQLLMTAAAGAVHTRGAFGQIAALVPPFLRDLAGSELFAMLSFSGVVSIGYFHLGVTSALVALAITLASEPAAEIEAGVADMVLSRPVARSAIVTRSVVVLCSGILAVLGVMLCGTWFGLATIAPAGAPRPSAWLIVSLAANLGALALAWGGIALAAAAIARRRAVAGGATGLAALALLLGDYLGRVWPAARLLGRVSPFHYYNGAEMVARGAARAFDLCVLLAVAVTATILAYFLFERRDV